MKTLVLNRTITLSIFVMIVLLICGLHGITYGAAGGVCQVGDVLSPGESCTDPGTGDTFSVLNNGSGRYLFITAGRGINLQGSINGKQRNFVADKRADGNWEIKSVTPGGGAQPDLPQPTPQPAPQPDLVIQSIQSNKGSLAPGERFTLSATVRNSGDGRASSTTLRYYRSSDATISSRDTAVGTDSVSALAANRIGDESINLTAPTSPGTYYYGVCVDSVTDESDTDNNCSTAVSVTVTAPPVVSEVDPDTLSIYWTTGGTGFGTQKIQRANLDGSNIEDLVTQGHWLTDIALDVASGKIYWVDFGEERIQRANLDGSNIEAIPKHKVGGLRPWSVALDVASGKMYWTDAGTGFGTQKIQRANLDGSNIEDLVTQELDTLHSIALDVAGGKMYWVEDSWAKIHRANLDGSNVEDLVRGGLLASPQGIALDVAGGKMYWADRTTSKIQRANLDGSNIEDLVTERQGLMSPQAVALDVASGKMYWTDAGTDKIQRANLDGSSIEDLITGLSDPSSIALGISSQALTDSGSPTPDLVIEAVLATPVTVAPGEKFRLYATLKNQGTAESTATTVRYYRSTDRVITPRDTQLGSARRNSLAPNATLRRYLIITAPTTPGTYYYGVCVDSVTNESDTDNNCSIAVSVTVTAPAVVAEDVNDDGVVDVQDLVYVARRYGQTGTNSADVNKDRVVNVDDMILIAAVLDADAAAPSLHPATLEGLTVVDVQLWLSQAQQRDLTDLSVRRGILFLEQLLASMVPKETVLLANYPNPFNPETWIPYQLSKAADVTLTIYDIQGHVVRALGLGHQAAGMYQSRSRAAYWDGRNALGEPVASGVYFYTLSTGDFSATRKMLIRK